MIPVITKGRGITGLVQYVLGEGRRDPATGHHPTLAEGEASRAAWFGGQNFGAPVDTLERVETARRMMEWEGLNQSSRTRKCELDALHLTLSWHPGETPDRREMEAAAAGALKALGMERARAVFVAHSDTDHAHLHIVASRIDPETGRAFSDRFEQRKIASWAKDWELAHGHVLCEGRLTPQELAARWREQPELVLQEVTKNQATFTRAELERALGKAIAGDDNRADFATELLARHEVIGLRETADSAVTRYTTREVLAAERALVKDATALAKATGHTVRDDSIQAVLARRAYLGDEQRAALAHATGRGGLAIIAGEAGTGKSATLAAVREAYEAEGHQVLGLAWTNAVVQDMRRDGFASARTIAAELKRLAKGTDGWTDKTVLVIDEAAMLATSPLAQLAAKARDAGAKLILAGDDRQLASIERGGMFRPLRDAHGAAELHEVRRVADADQREAFNRMHAGDFATALRLFDARGAVQWSDRQDEARAALVARYVIDQATDPGKRRFAFAYTNADVDALNHDIRAALKACHALGADHVLQTAVGAETFAPGDRIQFTGNAYKRTDKEAGLVNGNVGTIRAIDGARVTVALDGKTGEAKTGDAPPEVTFTVGENAQAGEFRHFRHGYAGTIYKGQGRTLDQSYLYHSPQWRAASSYVALSRHRAEVAVFVARETVRNVQPWMAEAGGYAALTPALQQAAAQSYAAWGESNPDAAARHDLADYVTYVQGKWAEDGRRSDDLTALARQMGRADTKRAATAYVVDGPALRQAAGDEITKPQGEALAPLVPAPPAPSVAPAAAATIRPSIATPDGGMVAQQREATQRARKTLTFAGARTPAPPTAPSLAAANQPDKQEKKRNFDSMLEKNFGPRAKEDRDRSR